MCAALALPASCPVASSCGGCPLLGTSPEDQAEHRLESVRRTLRSRVEGKAAACPEPAWVGAPAPLGYRNRIRVQLTAAGLGFFNPRKSEECPVLEPALTEALEELRCTAREAPEAFAAFSHAEVRTPGIDGRASLFLVPSVPAGAVSPPHPPRLAGDRWLVAVAGGEQDVRQRYTLRDSWWDVPLGSFMQVNTAMNERLVGHAVVEAARREVRTFLDAFSGAGNFALPLARAGRAGQAVERDGRAVLALGDTARSQGLGRLRVCRDDAGRWATRAFERGERFDLVVLDPPRAGLKGEASRFAALARRYVLLCSCNPVTMAGDLSELCAEGFAIESVTAFDMFPQTRHVEVAVWLRRSGDGSVAALPGAYG